MAEGLWTYKILIDPFIKGIRREIMRMVQPGSSVLDIASGTGLLIFSLSPVAGKAVGVDMNRQKVEMANRTAKKNGLANLSFLEADASKISDLFTARSFDYAIMSLAIHQFPEPLRSDILLQAVKISRQLILADYSFPVPGTPFARLTKVIEKLAGEEHYSAYKSFLAAGGLPGIIENHNITALQTVTAGNGVFTIMQASGPSDKA